MHGLEYHVSVKGSVVQRGDVAIRKFYQAVGISLDQLYRVVYSYNQHANLSASIFLYLISCLNHQTQETEDHLCPDAVPETLKFSSTNHAADCCSRNKPSIQNFEQGASILSACLIFGKLRRSCRMPMPGDRKAFEYGIDILQICARQVNLPGILLNPLL